MLDDTQQRQLQPRLDALAAKIQRLRESQPLSEPFVRSLEHKLGIELTHGSTAIEGNTLTLRETQLLVEEGITPTGAKPLREIHETLNHHRSLGQLQNWVKQGRRCDETGLCELHRIVMTQIDDERGGVYRNDRVFVTGAPVQPIRPERIPDAMRELMEWIGSASSSSLHPVLAAGEAHHRFVKIHPFYDGNGRTARLLLNWILLAAQYPLTVIPAAARACYITSIDEADRGQPLPWFELLCDCVESSLDQYLDH